MYKRNKDFPTGSIQGFDSVRAEVSKMKSSSFGSAAA